MGRTNQHGGRSLRMGAGMVGAAALAAAGLVATTAPATAAVVACDPDTAQDSFVSIDGDVSADAVVGVPAHNGGRGAIDIRWSGGSRTLLTAAGLGLPPSAAGDGFGASVSIRDITGDGCAEVAVGAPGRDGSGVVYLFKGTGSGSGLTPWGILTEPHAQAGARFGTAVAFGGSQVGSAPTELWVGAPRHDVGGLADAGAVVRYPVSSGSVGAGSELDQDDPAVPGSAEAGDQFGAPIATGRFGVAAIGTPFEDAGTRTDAGMVSFLSFASGSLQGTYITQDTPGIAGAAEAGDRFGASVAVLENVVAVGVPREDIGSDTNTGMVHLLRLTGITTTELGAHHQDSTGVPGSGESGDYYGFAVALGRGTLCQEETAVAAGAPGEDVGSLKNAGAVTLVTVPFGPSDMAGCPARGYTQNTSGVPGTSESHDEFGYSLATLRYRDDFDEDTYDSVLVGSPGEGVGTAARAGSVTGLRQGAYWSTSESDGATPSAYYGRSLGVPGGSFQ